MTNYRDVAGLTGYRCGDDVSAIRETCATGDVNQRQLAKLYGMSRWQIGRIVRRQVWKHVP